jgi:hypothetical protein
MKLVYSQISDRGTELLRSGTIKSIYTIARERRFEKAALKKYAGRIAAIQQHYPNWTPIF